MGLHGACTSLSLFLLLIEAGAIGISITAGLHTSSLCAPAGLWDQAGVQAKVPVVVLKQDVQASTHCRPLSLACP